MRAYRPSQTHQENRQTKGLCLLRKQRKPSRDRHSLLDSYSIWRSSQTHGEWKRGIAGDIEKQEELKREKKVLLGAYDIAKGDDWIEKQKAKVLSCRRIVPVSYTHLTLPPTPYV